MLKVNATSQVTATVELNASVFWVITQREVVWHRRFGTTYRPMFKLMLSSTPYPFKTGPICSPKGQLDP
jgi:hypothetical protein